MKIPRSSTSHDPLWRRRLLAACRSGARNSSNMAAPDGGDGGRGGDVWAECVDGLKHADRLSLSAALLCQNPASPAWARAAPGAMGTALSCACPKAQRFWTRTKKTVIADLTEVGQRVLLAKGGNGGWGNLQFKSSTNQSPRRANSGQPGVEREIWLRLKLIADAGLAGLPNAGKSTFLAATSNARPKIADYPFTTLHPNLGVVGVDAREFVMADIPGLIEGASEGRGLGDQFLGHVERCAVLLQLVDGTAEDVAEDWRIIDTELHAYSPDVALKPRIVAMNKIDALDDEERTEKLAALEAASRRKVMMLSAVSGEGVQDVLRAVIRQIDKGREAPEDEGAWQP